MRTIKWLLTTAFTIMGLLVSSTQAQVTTGDIAGRVVDPQQKLVAGASITATNQGTGATRTATTNDAGEFTITELPPGKYDVTVEAPNFSKSVVRGHEVNVGATPTLTIEMKPGELTAVVEVSADTVAIETTKSDIGGVVTPLEVQNLPLLNRTFAALSVIMPEARPVGNFDPTKTRVGNVAFNGGDGRQVDVNVDGGDNKDNVVGSLLQNFSYESIQEFQVLQHRWTAEQGRAVGGVVNVITKSGSNDLHGSFFANFRDEQFRAFDFFEKQRRLTEPNFQKPSFSRQEIGGSIGGRIVRDKLFFFGALERFRERQVNALSANAALQLPAIPGIGEVGDIPTPYDDWLATVKVDHRMTDNQSMFYRYAYQKNNSPNDQIGVPATADITGGNTNDNKLHSFIVNHTWTISPTKLNQISFHYQDFSNFILGVTDRPNIVFPSVQTGRNANVPQSTLETKYQFRDDFSASAGNHNLKAGVNYIDTKLDGFFFFGAQGHQIQFFADPLVIQNNTNGLYPQGFATPGAVRQITFSDGRGDHTQKIHQLALYFQDDWKVRPTVTLNLGLRWDANIGNLPNQENNRTILILQQLNHPLAQAITRDPEKLRRTTPSWTEFQPRVGFAWDPTGSARTVIRGGYGIFFDQLFQNLTLFSLTQTNPELFQTALTLVNTAVGVGQLSTFRFGIDPLPQPPPGFSFADLAVGGFGRINDPDASEPYIQKLSLGFETQLGRNTTLSSDYVHTLGLHESRVQVINPRIRPICDAAFPGSNPASPLCVRGANTRLLDRAFVDAGFPAGRIEQINMIGTTNRSLFDSWTTTFRHRTRKMLVSASYVLAESVSWGGQPVASYSGNGIAITPDNQFKREEYGPTRIDERHRIVVSGVFDLPWEFQLAPIMQLASSRPYSLNLGLDIDGDGLATNDRICASTSPAAVFAARGNSAALAALNPPGCIQVQVNSVREGFVQTGPGTFETRSGRYFNVDLRAQKAFSLGERFKVKAYADFYNLFNTENLSFSNRLGNTAATAAGLYQQPNSLYGPGFGPPIGRPLTVQFGARLDF
ncbi:MAG TPA: TonB-dependent receptor [Pyrinomonadaceae bacterium]|nr:TonB-dependent receptor [Pyrinomonadaceae bacterium]